MIDNVNINLSSIENVSEKFNLETYLDARKLTQNLVKEISDRVEVGMFESDGIELIGAVFDSVGIEKTWHPHKFRIGHNTTKAFREKSDLSISLQNNDLYFVDVGPVINGHEADFGKTFVVGENSEFLNITEAVEKIFQELNARWNSEKLSGDSLYRLAESLAGDFGYDLNLDMAGHRLGDFPHALFYKGSLSGFERRPIENLWVLELLISDVSNSYGAFYEDILC